MLSGIQGVIGGRRHSGAERGEREGRRILARKKAQRCAIPCNADDPRANRSGERVGEYDRFIDVERVIGFDEGACSGDVAERGADVYARGVERAEPAAANRSVSLWELSDVVADHSPSVPHQSNTRDIRVPRVSRASAKPSMKG